MFAATDRASGVRTTAGQTWAEKTQGLPWKEIQGFAGGSDAAKNLVMLYCSIRSKDENGAFKGGIYRSRDRGETWESAMGQGLNTETKQADQWAYGPISQYHQLLATDAKPLTVYAFNTSTGFHPPHSDTVYRSDDGGETWRATYFQDPRFKDYNVAPDWETASCGQCFKGGETPFGAAICNTRSRPRDPRAQRAAHHSRRRRDLVRRPHLSRARPEARPALRLGLQRPGRHHHLAFLHRSLRTEPPLHLLHRHRLGPLHRRRPDVDLVGSEVVGAVAEHLLRNGV